MPASLSDLTEGSQVEIADHPFLVGEGACGLGGETAATMVEPVAGVVAIAPGLFLTPMLGQASETALESLARQAVFHARLGDPSEFAAPAVHIIENQMINGEVIRLDGALRMSA